MSTLPDLIQRKLRPVFAAFNLPANFFDSTIKCYGDLCGEVDDLGIDIPSYTISAKVELTDENRQFLNEDDENTWQFEKTGPICPGPNGTLFQLEHIEQIKLSLDEEEVEGYFHSEDDFDIIDFCFRITTAEHMQVRDWFGKVQTGNADYVADNYDSEAGTDEHD